MYRKLPEKHGAERNLGLVKSCPIDRGRRWVQLPGVASPVGEICRQWRGVGLRLYRPNDLNAGTGEMDDHSRPVTIIEIHGARLVLTPQRCPPREIRATIE